MSLHPKRHDRQSFEKFDILMVKFVHKLFKIKVRKILNRSVKNLQLQGLGARNARFRHLWNLLRTSSLISPWKTSTTVDQ